MLEVRTDVEKIDKASHGENRKESMLDVVEGARSVVEGAVGNEWQHHEGQRAEGDAASLDL